MIGPDLRAPIQIAPERRFAITIEHTPATVVETPNRPYWDEKGWTCVTENGRRQYLGVYRVLDRNRRVELTFPGRVIEERDRVHAYISKPPAQCRQHAKWPCFSHQGEGIYRLEWYRAASNPDEAILYFERILDEAVNGSRRARYR